MKDRSRQCAGRVPSRDRGMDTRCKKQGTILVRYFGRAFWGPWWVNDQKGSDEANEEKERTVWLCGTHYKKNAEFTKWTVMEGAPPEMPPAMKEYTFEFQGGATVWARSETEARGKVPDHAYPTGPIILKGVKPV